MKCSYCEVDKEHPEVFVVLYAPIEIKTCNSCWPVAYLDLKSKKRFVCDLNSSVDTYTRKDGSKGKITKGKAWEIENRKTSPEGQIVNRKTGKPTQY